MFYRSYLDNAKKILINYTGQIPFSIYLKQFFSAEKQFGSRDRKMIASICFHYFRIVNGMPHASIDTIVATAVFLTVTAPIDFIAQHNEEWLSHLNDTIEQKATLAGVNLLNLFPLNNELSPQIDAVLFNASHLHQPSLFIRIRPGFEDIVHKKLSDSAIPFKVININCLELSNSTKLDNIISINKEAVIQDYNSQQIQALFSLINFKDHTSVWDCCAASGGKTIMLHDFVPGVNITASDIRNSIVHNLKKRISQAGLLHVATYCADSSNAESIIKRIGRQKYDVIICDTPCSGSGTWGRTPEYLKYFQPSEIAKYNTLQRKITSTTMEFVKKNGYFLYITCSVFYKENEEIISFIRSNYRVEVIEEKYLMGYNKQADTMYACLLRKTED